MSEPEVIGVFKFSHFGPRIGSFYKLSPNDPKELQRKYLYENGLVRLTTNQKFGVDISTGSKLTNRGPVHPDDWYWNESERRFIEMATLSDEEYLTVAISDAIRITISEWDDGYIECATEEDARYNVNKISSPLRGGLHTR